MEVMEMKKINHLMTVLTAAALGLWVIKALLDYHNYTRHIDLFAANGWTWYEDAMSWGTYIVPLVAVCLIAKLVIRKKQTA